MTHRLWHIHGGLHLSGHKKMSMHESIREAAIPAELILPLQQHIGKPARPCVTIGDRVLKGQMVAEASSFVSSPVHASTSGKIMAIENRPVPHVSGLESLCIVLEADGRDEAIDMPRHDYQNMAPAELRHLLRDAGIVGLGGAGFPSFIKLNPGTNNKVKTLLINGAECEPYITCDAMLMQQRAHDILKGLLIMKQALQAEHCIIAIEDNKRIAHTMMVLSLEEHESHDIEIIQVPTLYPTGGEKQLIKIVTGKEIPSRSRPVNEGIVCHNVATAVAVYDAMHGLPLISRVVTVTGEALQPHNLQVRLGTPFRALLEECGLDKKAKVDLIMGGPLMGFKVHDANVPIIKTSNCLLTLKQETPTPAAMPCIRCAECARVCPIQLLPQQLYWYARAQNFDRVQDYNLFDCIECGACAYVCPSQIPLVNYYRFAKNEIWAQEEEKKKSDLARQRHEFRQYRMERKKKEDDERKRRKKELLKKTGSKSDDKDAKKTAIEAAMARVKARRAEQEQEKKNTANLNEAQKKAIEDIEARRKNAGENK
ncbi:Electron transport complex protein RnfC [hydrothermal vent metagenome]|uniref:Electron transport complex protein RnfC n=1 Tax=hydrothermal vent metagenome TaxID=652676 RepID=A0A3B1BGJ9_9ZZZZ